VIFVLFSTSGKLSTALAGWKVTTETRRSKLVFSPLIFSNRGIGNHLDWNHLFGLSEIVTIGPMVVVVVVC